MENNTVVLNGEEYILSPFTINQLIEIEPVLEQLNGGSVISTLKASRVLIHRSLSRKHKDITEEMVGELIDLSNFNDIVNKILKLSKMIGDEKGSSDEKK